MNDNKEENEIEEEETSKLHITSLRDSSTVVKDVVRFISSIEEG
jgi:hypothetical protein